MPLYAAVLALLAPDSLAPDVLVDISRIVVVAILPVGFFAVGAALMEDAGAGGPADAAAVEPGDRGR